MAKRSSKHAQTTWKGLKIRLLECPIEVNLLILWVLAWQIFEQLAIFPGLNRVLEMGPHEGRVEMDSLLLCCHLSVDAAQDNVGPLGCKCALLAHDISFIYQVFLGRVSLKEFFYSLYAYLGFPWLWWNTLLLALLTLIRFMYAHFSSLSKSIWVVSFPSVVINYTTHLGVCKISESVLSPTVQVIFIEDVKKHWSSLVTGLHRDIKPLTVTI